VQLVTFIALLFISTKSFSFSNIENFCIIDSTEIYSLPPYLLNAVLEQEGGTPGEFTRHQNGSVDIGRGQINRKGAWARELERMGITEDEIKNNPCINILCSAFILSSEIKSVNNDIALGVGNYHRGYSSVVTISRAEYFLKVYSRYLIIKNTALYSN
jgi:hypothetical protein